MVISYIITNKLLRTTQIDITRLLGVALTGTFVKDKIEQVEIRELNFYAIVSK